jgi:hypothetical protein
MAELLDHNLKVRMDEAGEALNWSALAQRAFREAIVTRAVQRNRTDVFKVVERLRASKERFETGERQDGIKCGRIWAKQHAAYDKLKKARRFLNK